jgi:hypothetical protein
MWAHTCIKQSCETYLTLTGSWFQAAAERKLVEKLKGLGYIKTAAVEANTSTAQ